MTLADCIARYQETQAQPINARTSGLTSLGHAVVAANRLKDALAPLPASERASILRAFLPDLAELIPA